MSKITNIISLQVSQAKSGPLQAKEGVFFNKNKRMRELETENADL